MEGAVKRLGIISECMAMGGKSVLLPGASLLLYFSHECQSQSVHAILIKFLFVDVGLKG